MRICGGEHLKVLSVSLLWHILLVIGVFGLCVLYGLYSGSTSSLDGNASSRSRGATFFLCLQYSTVDNKTLTVDFFVFLKMGGFSNFRICLPFSSHITSDVVSGWKLQPFRP